MTKTDTITNYNLKEYKLLETGKPIYIDSNNGECFIPVDSCFELFNIEPKKSNFKEIYQEQCKHGRIKFYGFDEDKKHNRVRLISELMMCCLIFKVKQKQPHPVMITFTEIRSYIHEKCGILNNDQ